MMCEWSAQVTWAIPVVFRRLTRLRLQEVSGFFAAQIDSSLIVWHTFRVGVMAKVSFDLSETMPQALGMQS